MWTLDCTACSMRRTLGGRPPPPPRRLVSPPCPGLDTSRSIDRSKKGYSSTSSARCRQRGWGLRRALDNLAPSDMLC